MEQGVRRLQTIVPGIAILREEIRNDLNQLKTMEKKNERIVLIPERGLCYVSNWPEEPSYDYDGLGHASKIEQYEWAVSKALSEAVLFNNQRLTRAELICFVNDSEKRTAGNLFTNSSIKENHPYPVPTGYRVERRANIQNPCWRCGKTDREQVNGCLEISCYKGRPDYQKSLAYLLPIEKEATVKDKELIAEMIQKVHEDIEGRYALDSYDKTLIHSFLCDLARTQH